MVTIKHPDYIVSVGNAYFADRTVAENGTVTYGTVEGVDTIKSIGISKQKAEQKIFASGRVYKFQSKKTGTQLSTNVVALPAAMLRKLQGKAVSTNKGFAFEQSIDNPPEFAFGYTREYSSGLKVFVWNPRCQLTSADITVDTSSEQPTDPSYPYVIITMADAAGMIEVEYDQSEVVTGKKPLTEDEFFAVVIDKVTDAKVDSEVANP